MGMFDHVNVSPDVYLPEYPSDVDRSFQTISMDRNLDVYDIDNDGNLFVRGWKENSTKPSKFTGEIEFYAPVVYKLEHEHGEWFEYRAQFVNGQLIHIERIFDF